jgi:hypothetical protein
MGLKFILSAYVDDRDAVNEPVWRLRDNILE